METTVKIDGKDVRFKATAAVPLLYRRKFRRDLIRDVQEVVANEPDSVGDQGIETIARMAYIMAYHADPASVPDSLEEWLEITSPMALFSVIPVVMALWSGNLDQVEESKKKAEQLTGILQRLSFFSELSSLGSPSGTSIF